MIRLPNKVAAFHVVAEDVLVSKLRRLLLEPSMGEQQRAFLERFANLIDMLMGRPLIQLPNFKSKLVLDINFRRDVLECVLPTPVRALSPKNQKFLYGILTDYTAQAQVAKFDNKDKKLILEYLCYNYGEIMELGGVPIAYAHVGVNIDSNVVKNYCKKALTLALRISKMEPLEGSLGAIMSWLPVMCYVGRPLLEEHSELKKLKVSGDIRGYGLAMKVSQAYRGVDLSAILPILENPMEFNGLFLNITVFEKYIEAVEAVIDWGAENSTGVTATNPLERLQQMRIGKKKKQDDYLAGMGFEVDAGIGTSGMAPGFPQMPMMPNPMPGYNSPPGYSSPIQGYHSQMGYPNPMNGNIPGYVGSGYPGQSNYQNQRGYNYSNQLNNYNQPPGYVNLDPSAATYNPGYNQYGAVSPARVLPPDQINAAMQNMMRRAMGGTPIEISYDNSPVRFDLSVLGVNANDMTPETQQLQRQYQSYIQQLPAMPQTINVRPANQNYGITANPSQFMELNRREHYSHSYANVCRRYNQEATAIRQVAQQQTLRTMGNAGMSQELYDLCAPPPVEDQFQKPLDNFMVATNNPQDYGSVTEQKREIPNMETVAANAKQLGQKVGQWASDVVQKTPKDIPIEEEYFGVPTDDGGRTFDKVVHVAFDNPYADDPYAEPISVPPVDTRPEGDTSFDTVAENTEFGQVEGLRTSSTAAFEDKGSQSFQQLEQEKKVSEVQEAKPFVFKDTEESSVF